MNSPVSASSYLARAQALRKTNDKASLIYAALELRCGIEARLQEHVSVAHGVSRRKAEEWEIKNLGRTVEQAFALGDSMLWVFLTLEDGRSSQFMYAPVSARLQEIGKRCGDYLHAIRPERVEQDSFWVELREMVTEGCGLLKLACASEILRPTFKTGLHFSLKADDPRLALVQDYLAGAQAKITAVTITPTSRVTYYPADEA